MIRIEPVINGAMVDIDDEGKVVYKFDEDNPGELIDMLYYLADCFYSTGRYDEKRINISLVHGDKYECKDKKCDICERGNK